MRPWSRTVTLSGQSGRPWSRAETLNMTATVTEGNIVSLQNKSVDVIEGQAIVGITVMYSRVW